MINSLILILSITILNSFLYSQNNDFIMGSIVKSDEWEIDRKKNKEIFEGNVFFENKEYLFKSSKAVYDHNLKQWDAINNVYAKKKIDYIKKLEIFSDTAKYKENDKKLEISSLSDKKIKIIYTDSSSQTQTYTTYSKNALIDGITKEIFFVNEFELITSSISASSQKAIYREKTDTFEMTENPEVKSSTEKHNLYLKGEKIILFREEKRIEAVSVYGCVFRKLK